MSKISPRKLRVSIYTVIDLVLLFLFFILILPFLVDLSSILFVNKPYNLFAFAKIFPSLFNSVINANQWVNGTILAICFFYIIILFYFNIHFSKIIFNREKWLRKYAVILVIETLFLTVILLMILWSFLKMLYHLRITDSPLSVIVLSCIPIIHILTLFYWIPMFFIKGWSIVLVGLYLFWLISAILLLCEILYKGFWKLLRTEEKWAYAYMIDNQEEFINETNELTRCQVCDVGLLEIKHEANQMIVRCNNQQECQYFMPLAEFIFEFFQLNGVRIYQWEKECWKCQKNINIYAYFPSYQLKQVLKDFDFHFGGPGLFPTLDEYLKNNYQTITDHFSKKFNKTFVVNNCRYCQASQGKYLTIESPYEILEDIKDNKLDEKYLDKIIDFDTCRLPENEVANCLAFLNENSLKS